MNTNSPIRVNSYELTHSFQIPLPQADVLGIFLNWICNSALLLSIHSHGWGGKELALRD